MKTPRVLLIGLIAFAMVWGCKKEGSDETPAPTPTPTTPTTPVFEAFFHDNVADATQTFTMNASLGGTLIAAEGTQLVFEPGAFLYQNGTPVTGAVNVSVVEALTIGKMIWLNKQTVGNDNGTLRMLRSGGAINVFASQGGSMVQITQSGLIAQIPTTVGDPNMSLFTGTEDADGNMIWDPIDSASVTVDPGYYTAPTYTFPYYFAFSLSADSLNWINCDYFGFYPNTTGITATIPAGQSADSTVVWIGFPSENAVLQMYYWSPPYYTTTQAVPVGMQAVVVGLQQTPTGYASSFSTVTITSSMNVPMTFSPTTLAQFEADVDAL